MAIEIKDKELKEMFEHGLYFHGHLCPAMPLGLRAGLLALRTLGVGRSQDKELMLLAETAADHAMACFLDGLMMATGCTYRKGNVKKLRYGKLAFTLIDRKGKRLALVLGGAVFSSAQVGARLGVKIAKKKHKKYFGYLLIFIACWMVYMAFKRG